MIGIQSVPPNGEDPAWENETASELVDRRGAHPNLPSRMIRSDRWKLWVHADAEALPPALFDLENDPGELHDLGEDPAHAAVRDRLLDRVRRGWEPGEASRGSVENEEDLETIARWGRATTPRCEDTLPSPSPELEAQVELL